MLAEESAALKTGVQGDVLRGLAVHTDCTPEALGDALMEEADTVEATVGLTKSQAASLVDKVGLRRQGQGPGTRAP